MLYPVTMGDLMCPGGGPECELTVTLTETPDIEDLKKALQMTMQRLPFLASELCCQDGRLYLQRNERPFPVRKESAAVLGSDAQNGHLICVFCRGNDIVFRFLHAVMDGRGGLIVLKLLLHCYLLVHYGEDLRCEGLLLPSDPPSEEDYADPFARVPASGRDIDRDVSCSRQTEPACADFTAAKQTSPAARKHISPAVQKRVAPPEAFTIPEEDLVTEGPITNYIIHIPKASFLHVLSSLDQSPAPFLTLLLCRAMDAVYPDRERPIVLHSPADIRKILGCEKTLQYCITSLWFTYDDRIRKMPADLQMTCFRGMLFRQMYPDYVMQEAARMRERYEENVRCRLRGEPLYVPWASMPYMLTYVGNTDFGEMGKYVRPLSIVNTAPVPLLCSVTESEGVFRLSMELQTKIPAIYQAYLQQLDLMGISYTEGPAIHLPRPDGMK